MQTGGGSTDPGEPVRADDGSGAVGDDAGADAAALVGSILDGLTEPTVVVDTDGAITHVNDQALALFETTAAEAVGAHPHELWDADVTDAVGEALTEDRDVQDDEATLTVDGEETPVSRTVTLLTDDDGDRVGALAVYDDITERRRERRRKRALEDYQERALDDLRDKLARLAEGDLTVDPSVPEPDEDFEAIRAVYEEFDAMNGDLGRAVYNIRQVVEALTAQSDDLATTSDQLAASSEEVTASVEEIDASTGELADGADDLAERSERASATVEDLSASFQQITATVGVIDDRSAEAADMAGEGVADVESAVGEIRGATDATDDVARRIDSLEASMTEVGEIVEMIAEIADQTNMLALNANIEAARAGEAGEGFAVVAEEVKSLAEQSQDSAEDIARIIEEVRQQTDELVGSVRQANRRVEDGADAVETVGDRLDAIRDHVEATSQGVTEITDAVETQAENAAEVTAIVEDNTALAEEIAASVEQISTGVDDQTTAMDEVAHSAEHLNAMSDDVHGLVDRFGLEADEEATIDEADAV